MTRDEEANLITLLKNKGIPLGLITYAGNGEAFLVSKKSAGVKTKTYKQSSTNVINFVTPDDCA